MDKIKIKKILRWGFAGALAGLSLLLVTAFAVYLLTPRSYSSPPMNTAGIVAMWVVILGAGVPGGLLLRNAILDIKSDKAEGAACEPPAEEE